jgi:hypothetical protein
MKLSWLSVQNGSNPFQPIERGAVLIFPNEAWDLGGWSLAF